MATGVAGSRPLVVSDLLCFAVNKFHRVANKPLKAVIMDFYNADDITSAKELLLGELDKVFSDKWQKPARRRKDSSNRSTSELDDIMSVLTIADNNKVIDQLPSFVSTDPDKMPSVKLTDGDLAVVLLKLSKIEAHQGTIVKAIDELKTIDAENNCSSRLPRNHRANVHKPSTTYANTVPSTSLDMVTTDGTETDDNDGFEFQRSNKRKKPSSTHPSKMPHTLSYASAAAVGIPPQTTTGPKPRLSRPTMVGASSSCSLRASKALMVKKTVYCLGNIDSAYSVADIEDYIRSLDVRVLSCYELKQSVKQPADNKAFRVCIVASDKQKLCDSNNWSIGVSLREWVHKPKITLTASSAAADGVKSAIISSQPLSTATQSAPISASDPDRSSPADGMQDQCDDN